MGKNVILGVLIALIVVVLAVGIGTIVWLANEQDDFSGATVLESPEEIALRKAIESLQADQVRLKQELEAAKKATEKLKEANTTQTETIQTDSLGLLSDLSNCNAIINSLQNTEEDLRDDVEEALEEYEDEIEELILLEKELVDLKFRIANETDSTKRDSLRDEEKDLEDDIKEKEDDADRAENDFDDFFSEIQDVRLRLVDARIKCLDKVKQDLSANTCSASERDAKRQYEDAQDEISEASDDGNIAGEDTNEVQLKIITATNNKNNATTQVEKDQFDKEITFLNKVKKLFKEWEDEFDDFEDDLDKVKGEAKSVKGDVEAECRKY